MLVVYNLDASVTSDALRDLFSTYGNLQAAEISEDQFTGVSRGFGYVTFPDASEAQAAMRALHGQTFQGHVLTVEEAPEKREQKGSYKVGSGVLWMPRKRKG